MSPYKDKNRQIENDRKRYERKKESIKKKNRDYYRKHKKRLRKIRLELAPKHREKNNERERQRYAKWRKIVVGHYGGRCSCCGEKEFLFLEIDHVNNDGKQHRKKIGTSAKAMVKWLMDNDFPDNFQILCANCNQGKKRNGGICPHKLKKNR